jgi:2-polyprenyl-3-methyl-5-hydroxy-6-metoxy-1,4-benzoquinol methylase
MSASGRPALDFWNTTYLSKRTDTAEPVLRAALAHFGTVRGKRLLDVGCGRGGASIYFAAHGAEVVAIDLSHVAVDALRSLCTQNGIDNVRTEVCSAVDIAKLGPFDFAFGSMILHHLEPFREFATSLAHATAPGAKGFFYENNARSRLLLWFRKHLVGRFGIPKYGDPEESPLEPQEIEMLQDHFDVRIEFPELHYFRLVSTYLLGGRLHRLTGALDRWCYRREFLNHYSYRQYVIVVKKS